MDFVVVMNKARTFEGAREYAQSVCVKRLYLCTGLREPWDHPVRVG